MCLFIFHFDIGVYLIWFSFFLCYLLLSLIWCIFFCFYNLSFLILIFPNYLFLFLFLRVLLNLHFFLALQLYLTRCILRYINHFSTLCWKSLPHRSFTKPLFLLFLNSYLKPLFLRHFKPFLTLLLIWLINSLSFFNHLPDIELCLTMSLICSLFEIS